MNDIIDQAMEIEWTSRDYYRELSQKSITKYAGPALEQLVEEEQKHLDLLLEYRRSLESSGEVELPPSSQFAETWQQFTAALEEMRQAVQPHTDEVTVIQQAVELEKQGLELYRRVQEDATDEGGKRVFAFLAEQEVRHRDYLEGLLKRLMVLYQEPPETRPQL